MPSVTKLRLAVLPKPLMRGFGPLAILMLMGISIASWTWVAVRMPAEVLLSEQEGIFSAAKQAHARLLSTRKQQEVIKVAKGKSEANRRFLPTQNDFSTLSMSIAELGQREHVMIPGMTYNMQKKDAALPIKATMTFKATGDYASIYRFIQRLEESESYLVIESLDAARVDQHAQASGALVVFNMKVVTFLRPSDDSSSHS